MRGGGGGGGGGEGGVVTRHCKSQQSCSYSKTPEIPAVPKQMRQTHDTDAAHTSV